MDTFKGSIFKPYQFCHRYTPITGILSDWTHVLSKCDIFVGLRSWFAALRVVSGSARSSAPTVDTLCCSRDGHRSHSPHFRWRPRQLACQCVWHLWAITKRSETGCGSLPISMLIGWSGASCFSDASSVCFVTIAGCCVEHRPVTLQFDWLYTMRIILVNCNLLPEVFIL